MHHAETERERERDQPLTAHEWLSADHGNALMATEILVKLIRTQSVCGDASEMLLQHQSG